MLQTVESFLSESLLGGLLEPAASSDWRESLARLNEFSNKLFLGYEQAIIVGALQELEFSLIATLLEAWTHKLLFCPQSAVLPHQFAVSIELFGSHPLVGLLLPSQAWVGN